MTAHDARAASAAAELNVALARAVGRVHRECLGRGPTQAQAFVRHKLVIVVLSDVLTTQERSLLAAGRHDAVLDGRRELQAAMRTDLTAAVERLTGARVLACLSDTHVEPDMSATLFLLDREVSDAHTRAAPDDAALAVGSDDNASARVRPVARPRYRSGRVLSKEQR